MQRVLALAGAMALAALGCQGRNPHALEAFGPATIPPPGMQSPGGTPYYPPIGTGVVPSTAVPGSNPTSLAPPSHAPTIRSTIPAANSPANSDITPLTSAAPSFTTDRSDNESIRIVEASPSEIRTSSLPSPRESSTVPSAIQAAPAAKEPIRAFTTPPALNRTRGYTTPANASPASAPQSTGSFRTDPNIAPAHYREAAPAFFETPSAGGAWRAR